MNRLIPLLAMTTLVAPAGCMNGTDAGSATRFCLTGEFDLAARLQGYTHEPGEFSPATWCVITDDASRRVHFRAKGKSNPDMEGAFAVSYFPPDRVRIVNRDSPPDVEFVDASVEYEAMRYRRLDPRRLVAEIRANPDWIVNDTGNGNLALRFPGSDSVTAVKIANDRLHALKTEADFPLRGRVAVEWTWNWSDDDTVNATMRVDGDEFFRARGTWRDMPAGKADELWALSGGQAPRELPGDRWPAKIAMELVNLTDDVYLVRNVRTGFHHLVVDTGDGLVVGDAPAGWVEVPQVPPADLVPGLGISGLSELFIDFLKTELPDRPLRAVVLTHIHDDHAGGARAFAAEGAEVYAPAGVARFLETALNRESMPADRFTRRGGSLHVKPVDDRVVINGPKRSVEFINLGTGPHVEHSIGMYVPGAGFFFQSDLLVPVNDADEPRVDRAMTECWFARWAVDKLPEDTIVLSSHRDVRTPVTRLARYLESDLCPKNQGGHVSHSQRSVHPPTL